MTKAKTKSVNGSGNTTTEESVVWAYGVRTWNADGSSHGGLKWDLTPGARTTAPDWRSTPTRGNGLHANEDGWGDWALLGLDANGTKKVLGIVRWDSALGVRIDGGEKTKAPWMEVVMTSATASLASIYGFISGKWRDRMKTELATATVKVRQASGYSGHAQASGYSGHAQASGYRGHAQASGYSGHAQASGSSGHAQASGYSGHAQASGDSGHAQASGSGGHAQASGYGGHAQASGDSGHAQASGYSGHAQASGSGGHAQASGYSGHAQASGDSGHAQASGSSGHAQASGYGGHAQASGSSGHAQASGDRGHAQASGSRGHAQASGKYGIAAALGGGGTARAAEGGALMLAHWVWVDNDYALKSVFAGMVGQTYEGVTIEPGVIYTLGTDGALVKVDV